MNAPIELIADSTRDKIDEFARLSDRIAKDLERYEKLKKELGKVANEIKDDEAIVLAGHVYQLRYSKPTHNLVLNTTPQQFARKTKCWGAMKVSTADARKLLSQEQLDQFFDEQLGSRRLQGVR